MTMSISRSEESEILDLKELEQELAQLVDKSYLEENLKLQIAEYEMLQSMFSNPGEFSIGDLSVLADVNDYVNGKSSNIPNQLDYTINLTIGGGKFNVCVNLPLEYPNLEPDVFVRCEGLNRSQQRALNNEMAKYISELERGEICIGSAISWLQGNALQYFKDELTEVKVENVLKQEDTFTRFWIYSHHIYSKIKRREILDLANDYKVTGFCVPGRPGFICFEGFLSDCEEMWLKIKSMNWKRIVCKKIEETKLGSLDLGQLRRFSGFKEVLFLGGGAKKNDHHTDYGEFYKYLSSHKCEYIFKEYFGIEGK